MKKATTSQPILPQRRSLRLSGYDYSQAGACFVTLCTEKRSALFGEVVDGEMLLNARNPQKWQQDRDDSSRHCNTDDRWEMPRSETGFTLIEMIVVIVIVGILAVLGSHFIVAPVTGYVDLARRTRLVDQAEMALRRMQRDIRHALPNSIRIGGGGQFLEMLNTVDGGRYRRYQDPVLGGDILDFDIADTGFDVLGQLSRLPVAGERLVIYNISSTGLIGNAYAAVPDNTGVVGAGSNFTNVILTPGFQFANTSPAQRFFIVDQPVSYACEGGVLNRYGGYAVTPAQPTPPPTGNRDLVTKGVTGCNFSYAPGTSQRAGLVTMRLTLAEEGEVITLLHQVHVINVP